MTISATYSPAQANGNGVTVAFPFTFKTFDEADLVVIITDASDVDTTQVITTDYSVSLNADQNNNPGGTVTMVTAPSSGETLTIAREIDALQETDIANGGGFYPEVVEDALDRLTMLAQQNRDSIGRAFTLPVTVAGINTELPVPVPNSIVGWNDAGTALQNYDSNVFATVVSFGTAKADIFDGDGVTVAFTLSANPGALNNLDVSIGGVTQTPGADYTWASGTTITFTTAPPSGTDNVLVRYMQGLAVANVQDGAFTPAGAGAVETTIRAKLHQLVSVQDYDTLANAKTAAGVKPLLDADTGTLWMLGITAPTFDEAAGVLGRGFAFDSLGATISIGAGKQYNFIGIRNGGSDINLTLGASSAMCTGMSFYLSSQSGSHSSSNLYGVIGDISNYGPGTTKAMYGRVVAKSGMTGDLIAGVFRTQLDTGSTPANAYCLQLGHAGDTSKALTGVIWIDSEAASGTAAYGILSDIKMGYTTAFIRGVAGGGGKAFQWQSSGGGADLMNILESGRITLAPASANSLMLDLQSGARINFTGTSASATTGGAGAPPAQVAQYVLVQVGGSDYKIPVYNV